MSERCETRILRYISMAACCALAISTAEAAQNWQLIVDPGRCVGPGCFAPQARVTAAAAMPVSNPEHETGQTLPAGLTHGAGPDSFDSGLRDCDIPFDQLVQRAPSCQASPNDPALRCEEYSRSQFTEIVQIQKLDNHRKWGAFCSGTLISPKWVLTAAHCFIGDASAAKSGSHNGADIIRSSAQLRPYRVSADNIMTLSKNEQQRSLARAIIYGLYGGAGKAPRYYADDLALAELATPLPAETIEPARLATQSNFKEAVTSGEAVTIGGFGYSNAERGTLGTFHLTWPPLVQQGNYGQLHFVPGVGGQHKSAFCQGDSGGPVLVGRDRGCKSTGADSEDRPHYIAGVISYDKIILPTGGSSAMTWAKACRSAEDMALQDITVTVRHNWICRVTNNEAEGC